MPDSRHAALVCPFCRGEKNPRRYTSPLTRRGRAGRRLIKLVNQTSPVRTDLRGPMSYIADSTMRRCDAPDCTEEYDAWTGPKGQTTEEHWLHHPTFGLHMCPDHSPLWRRDKSGPHCPNLDHATRTASCSCGHPLPGPTLGDMERAYLDHLASVVEVSGEVR